MNISPDEAKVILNWYEYATKETHHRGGETIITSAEKHLTTKLKENEPPVDLSDGDIALAGDWMLKTTRAKHGAITSLLPEEKVLYEKIAGHLHISQGIDIAKGLVEIKEKEKLAEKETIKKQKKQTAYNTILYIAVIIVILFLFWQFGFRRFQEGAEKDVSVVNNSETSFVQADLSCRGKNLPEKNSIELWIKINNKSDLQVEDGWVQIEFLSKSNAYVGLEYQISLVHFRPEYKIDLKKQDSYPVSAIEYKILDKAKKTVARGRCNIEFEQEE